MDNTCFKCGCKFTPSRSDQLFCSKRCGYKYHHKNDLTLTLKKQWFDMILSGEKTEEYREMKPYWEKRFNNYFGRYYDFSKDTPTLIFNAHMKDVVFKNGYQKNAPQFTAECTIREGKGRTEWGATEGEQYYILTIHRIYNVKNCDVTTEN